jgi:putative membrane protein
MYPARDAHDVNVAPMAAGAVGMTDVSPGTPRAPAEEPAAAPNGVAASSGARGPQPQSRKRPTRISSLHVGLITAAILLVLLVVFLVQNAHTVEIHFLGAHLRVSLAVAMLSAAVAGALITGAAGTARIAQLRRSRRRSGPAADGRSAEPRPRT